MPRPTAARRLAPRRLAAGLAAGLLALPAAAQEERSVDMADVPPAARAAAQAATGVSSFEAVALDLDGGVATYEFRTTTADGRRLEVDVTRRGRVRELENEIEMHEVPDKVQVLLRVYFPEMRPSFIERSTRGNLATWYEFEGEHDGRTIDIEVDAAGERILIQDDAAS